VFRPVLPPQRDKVLVIDLDHDGRKPRQVLRVLRPGGEGEA
jgi:hypothetical protein